jgi:hypothetical protein
MCGRMLPDVDEAGLEQHLRDLTFSLDCEFFIERIDDGRWRAAFKQFGDPAGIAPRGVILKAAEHRDRRGALEALRALAAQD